MNLITKTLKSILQKFIKDIDEDKCGLEDEELKQIISTLQDYNDKKYEMSKYQAYTYLNVSRATFDNYIKQGLIPNGKKIQGFKELRWNKKSLDNSIKQIKNKC